MEHRRHEDDPLFKRLSTLEAHFSTLERQVDRLTNDQRHQSEMSTVQFSRMEKAQELVGSKIDVLSTAITLMASEADKSAAGRALLNSLADVRGDVREHDRRIDVLAEWQTGIKAVLILIGSMSGLVSAAILVLKAVGVIRP